MVEWLYLILFLHQTTTVVRLTRQIFELYLILFLHQTTTSVILLAYFLEVTLKLANKKERKSGRRSVFDAIFLILPITNVMKYHANIKRTLKKFQLLGCGEFCSFNFSPKVLYFAILLIGYAQNTGQSRWWHRCSNPRYMHIHILFRWAMTNINRVLHHRKAIFLQRFAKLGGGFTFLFRGGWQVEKDK